MQTVVLWRSTIAALLAASLVFLWPSASLGEGKPGAVLQFQTGYVPPPKERARIQEWATGANFYGAYLSSGEGPFAHWLGAHSVEDAVALARRLCDVHRQRVRTKKPCQVVATLSPSAPVTIAQSTVSQNASQAARNFVSLGLPGAFAISSDGGWGRGYGLDPVRAAVRARENCEERRRTLEAAAACRVVAEIRAQ